MKLLFPDQQLSQLIIILLIMTFLVSTSKALFFLKFRKLSHNFSPSNTYIRFLSSSTIINEPDNNIKSDILAKNDIILKKSNSIKKDNTLDENVKVKLKITLLEKDLDEKFVRGSGNGGQKINTTSNRVQLTHIPTGISVSCQDARDLSTNRKIARKSLIDKLDLHFNGSESKLGIAHEKIRKKKKNAKRRASKKYASASASTSNKEGSAEVEDDGEDDCEPDELEILPINTDRNST